MIGHEEYAGHIGNNKHDENVGHAGKSRHLVDSSYEEEEIGPEPVFKGMKKLTPKQQKKFPDIVDDSMICQARYIARCENCNGCNCAIDGCEKVVYMPAG